MTLSFEFDYTERGGHRWQMSRGEYFLAEEGFWKNKPCGENCYISRELGKLARSNTLAHGDCGSDFW